MVQVELVNRDSGSHHTVIQVVGVGGGGSNAVRRMVEYGLDGVQFITANTDLQALESFQSPSLRMLTLGEKITGGLGAGGNPEVGREAAEEDVEKIRELLNEAHMVFVTAGMGGGTGTGAAPVIAAAAKDMGKLCVAVVTMPFHFEGRRKYELALQGLQELSKVVDTLIVIPNQLLLDVLDRSISVADAFASADEVLRMGVKGIADLITQPGDINVDFNDVCTVMRDSGKALMGIGVCSGEDRADQATRQALENPLLSGSEMRGATGLLVQITADETFLLEEYRIIMEQINAYVNTESATVISGYAIDNQKKDEIKVTVIATGFRDDEQKPASSSGGNSRAVGERREKRPDVNPVNPLQVPLQTPMSGQGNVRPAPSQYYNHRGQTAPVSGREAGQASQMRQALQDVDTLEAPDRVIYQMTDEDNRFAEEQQVSNTELEILLENNRPHTGRGVFGQKRDVPQPPQSDEDLYVPALLRRNKQRKKR
ncbi:MAG: cell division protein FtsZ [Spirochaetota bacterium]